MWLYIFVVSVVSLFGIFGIIGLYLGLVALSRLVDKLDNAIYFSSLWKKKAKNQRQLLGLYRGYFDIAPSNGTKRL